jgi:hypothetical protein
LPASKFPSACTRLPLPILAWPPVRERERE